ncbi:hypothetical protein GCM10008956_32430 [Deinococcus arenae]|uniref:Copper amine oxidase-like N-terminal domain-containing protein n=1 Tax=Deinococcus arenae TaxID=1452751 RepID=A0A8H9GRP8_9DEIO|nr:hypothetical protein [Deinococcus arenae]GGM54064.1 hypothetical protein GCM10008956_32430 [Deinococcus arenae]
MRKLTFTAVLALSSLAAAQPSYFSATAVRDDIAKRLGAYEIACNKTPVHPDDVGYSSCMLVSGGGNYPKSIIDIYYDDYMSGGWRFIDAPETNAWIRNTISRDGKSLSLNIIEMNSVTYVTVYDISLAAAVESQMQQVQMDKKASAAGGTPNSAYITLGSVKGMTSLTKSGNNYVLSSGSSKLEFTLGGRTAKLNGKSARLNATPFFMDGATYFPLASLKLIGCNYEDSNFLPKVQCGSGFDYVETYIFSTKNAPANAIQFPPGPASTAVANQSPIVTAASPRPSAASSNVSYVSMYDLYDIALISNMADESVEVIIGDSRLTYRPDLKQTLEGSTLEAAPFYREGVLLIPLSSLKLLGCSNVLLNATKVKIACPNGASIEADLLKWK